MHEATTAFRERAPYAMIAAALLLGACSTTDTIPVEPEPTEVSVVELEATTTQKRPTRFAAKAVRPSAPPPSISVVLSSRTPAYADVVTELREHFDDFPIYDFSDRSQQPVSAFRLINDANSTAVVAIGLRAARSSVAMSTSPVVFSQVFNFAEHSLLTDRSRAVSSIAPFDLQFAEWKRIAPSVSTVGLIIGAGHEELITEAELAAQKHGLELELHVSGSDQETLYIFRRLVRRIDGFWLAPDNRILSKRVLNEIMSESSRHDVLVVVPNESMLQMGAAISMSAVASDIAGKIVEIVMRIHKSGLSAVPGVTQLSELRTVTNDEVLNRHAVAEASR